VSPRISPAIGGGICDILLAVHGEASHGPAPLGWERTFTTRRVDGSATPPLLLSAGGFHWFCPGDSEVSQFFCVGDTDPPSGQHKCAGCRIHARRKRRDSLLDER
jgi:hypothetical protein